MVKYLDNTVYTNYALRKICENLIGDYERFDFLHVKVGSGDNTLSQDRTQMSTPLYSLRIKDTTYSDGIVTIICEIPPELEDVPITEIGLFDTVLGVDYLFSYSKVELTKPADLGYELTIVLNLGPRTIDFPGINIFEVNEPEYATRESLENFVDMFIYVDTNLERVVASNAEKIGYNMSEVAYERQLKLKNILKESTYATTYYSLMNRYGQDISDLYFLSKPNYLSYDIINFAQDNSYLTTYHDLFESKNDNFTFHKGPISIIWCSKLDDLSVESTLFNKKNNQHLYFSIDTKQNYEIYRIEQEKSDGTAIYHRALYNELVISIYGISDVYTIKYIFDETDKGLYIGQKLPYILSFNGDFENPIFKLYVDGKEPAEVDEPSGYEDVETQRARKESDLYGKIKYDEPSKLLDMPDYSVACKLHNYNYDYEKEEAYGYDNALGTNVLMTLKKQVDKYDVAFLSNLFKCLGESEN